MPTASTLNDWFATAQGQYLLERELTFFDHSVTDIFGFNALQLGLPEFEFLRASRIPLHIVAGLDVGAQVKLNLDELAFECCSLDLVLLPHVLEFNERPHQILREVERVLRPEGHLIISGFNPRSLWGLRRAAGKKSGYPWRGNFISLPRIKDWLALLGFEVVAGSFACYMPPFTHPGWVSRLNFLEPAGDRWWAVCGGVYFLQAVKRVPGMRLIKPQWNNRLMGKLLPSAPKLNKGVSQCNKPETQ